MSKDDNASVDSESTSDSHLCCCLCYCAVDYSDKEAFFGYEDDDDKPKPLLLPQELYHAQNALVLCDSCDRPYHQQCHFVPVVALPRGEWHCLLCKEESETQNSNKNGRKKQQQQDDTATTKDDIYPFPPKNESGEPTGDTTRQLDWEFASSQLKAVAWKREFARLQRALSLQLQNVRLAQDAIRSHTTSSRKSHTIGNPLKSQELMQCFYRLASSKLRVRQWLLSLDQVRTQDNGNWNILETFLEQHADQQDAWFPYGRDLDRRVIPRCGHDGKGEDTNATTKDDSGVPTEVVLNGDMVQDTGANNDDDDDDMISLDDLKCCICFVGDASDDNDVILCDGEGCFRAYHMKCVSPPVTLEQVEQDDDWFCPICTAMAKLVANVQSEFTGDDWQRDEDDATTIKSWDQAKDVFPEAEREFEMATRWSEGKHDAELATFISNVLGMPIEQSSGSGGDSQAHDEDEEEDDSDDDDFDLNTFQNRKRQEEDDEDESDASSNATLEDMPDVERKIARTELDALSLPSEDSDEDDSQVEEGRRRTRSARSSRAASANNSEDDSSTSSNRPDAGTLDESNILQGKRRRNQVDYRRLNDSMFGDVSENEAARMDDDDEFQAKIPSRRNSSSSGSGDRSSNASDDDGSGSESEDGEDESSSNEQSDEKPASKTKQASKKKRSKGNDSESSSLDEQVAKSRKKKPKRVVRKKSSPKGESSDDEDAAAKKPAAKKGSSQKSQKRRASRQDPSDDSSSASKEVNKTVKQARGKKQAPKGETPGRNESTLVNGKLKTRRSKRQKRTG